MATFFSTAMENPQYNYPYLRIEHIPTGIVVGPFGGESKSTYLTKQAALKYLRSLIAFGRPNTENIVRIYSHSEFKQREFRC